MGDPQGQHALPKVHGGEHVSFNKGEQYLRYWNRRGLVRGTENEEKPCRGNVFGVSGNSADGIGDDKGKG